MLLFMLVGFSTDVIAEQHEAHERHTGEHSRAYTRRMVDYQIPAVMLRNSHNLEVDLNALLAEQRPTLVQFIFTSCATICPMLSATFAQAQADVAAVRGDYRMISISIDPEYDTPKRLAVYAKRFNAGDKWLFLTGTEQAVRKVVNGFDVLFRSDNKMYHQPFTFLRAGPGRPWLRIEGLLPVRDLVEEYRKILGEADLISQRPE